MEFRNIETFLAVVEHSNFSEAANVLGYTQSTVSVQIRQLEEELGVKLFDRIGKRVKITEQGIRFYEHGQRILAEMNNAKTAIGHEEESRSLLRIGTFQSFATTVLPDIICELRREYPNIDVELRVEDVDSLFSDLKHNKLDLTYLITGMNPGDEFICEYEKRESLNFVCSPDHPLAGNTDIKTDILAKEEFILTEGHMKMLEYRYEFDRFMSDAGHVITPIIQTGSTEMITYLLKRMRAISFLPDYVTQKDVSEGSLVRLDVKDADLSLPIKLIYHKGKWVTDAMQAFISIVYAKKR